MEDAEFGVYASANASPAEPGGSTKVGFTNVDGANNGFDRVGWAPEGQVYFNYGVAINGQAFTASAGADIDNDSTPQTWGYKKDPAGTGVAAKDLSNGGTCAIATLAAFETVGPCVTSHGQSVF